MAVDRWQSAAGRQVLRPQYVAELDRISDRMVDMTSKVELLMSRATTALLDADYVLADWVIKTDRDVDDMRTAVEDSCFQLIARQQPVATDLRVIVTALSMVADLERMGDLASHVAKVAMLRFPESAVPSELRVLILEMAEAAQAVVAKTGSVIAVRDVERAQEMEYDDDAIDQLHKRLFEILLAADWPHGVETAIDLTLLGRYYERFADHGVRVARKVVYVVTGAMPPRAVSGGA